MKNSKVQCVIAVLLFITVGIWLFPPSSKANPKGLPFQNNELQREGYSRSFVVDANSVTLFEVPPGKDYVLLRVYSKETDGPPVWVWGESFWTLTVNGEILLDHYILVDPWRGAGSGVYAGEYIKEDFPDKCVVVHGGQTLDFTKHKDVEIINITLIGYFCDAQ